MPVAADSPASTLSASSAGTLESKRHVRYPAEHPLPRAFQSRVADDGIPGSQSSGSHEIPVRTVGQDRPARSGFRPPTGDLTLDLRPAGRTGATFAETLDRALISRCLRVIGRHQEISPEKPGERPIGGCIHPVFAEAHLPEALRPREIHLRLQPRLAGRTTCFRTAVRPLLMHGRLYAAAGQMVRSNPMKLCHSGFPAGKGEGLNLITLR